MPQYMIINGIKGDITLKSLEGAMAVMSTVYQGARPVQQHIGTANHEMGFLDLQHMQISKVVDSASPMLWQYFYTGKMIPMVEIVQCSVSQGVAQWRSKTTLYHVLISYLEDQGNSEGSNELVHLAYMKVERSYRSQLANGQWQAPKHTSFDLSTVRAG